MSKRKFPLFLYDTDREHNQRECDFVVCTDIDNGFVARIDYAENATESASDTEIIGHINQRTGIGLHIVVERIFGKNPNNQRVRTLLRKAFNDYAEMQKCKVHTENPSTEECISFLSTLIRGYKHLVNEAGVDFEKRITILTSIDMLEAVKKKLEETL